MKRFVLLAMATALLPAPAFARENRVLKCRTSAARGAQSPGGPVLVANVSRSMTPIDLNAVQMTDKALTRRMVVEGVFARRSEMDNLEVTARFVNCTAEPMAVQARASFLDADQMPTEGTSVWKTVFLPAYATGVYAERSIAQGKVATFLVELKSVDK